MEIPQEIIIRFASFLSVDDVSKYQSSCKYLKKTINLNVLHRASPTKILDLAERGDVRSGDKVKYWTTLTPFLFPSLIHTVKLAFDYRDQGWGNRKGNIYITETSQNMNQEDDIGTIVAKSPTAEHIESRCVLKFKPKIGSNYNLYYRVGGGGGHELFVRNVKVESFVHCAAAPLANKLFITIPDMFFMDMIRSTLDTIADNGVSGQFQFNRLFSLFQSVGLDLNNQQHIEHIQFMLQEFESLE